MKPQSTLLPASLLLILHSIAVPQASAQQEEATVIVDVLAGAEFDECIFDTYSPLETLLRKNLNAYKKSGLTEQEVADCYAGGGLAKRNQAYVWSLKKKGDKLWWGTGPNINSLVSGFYFGDTEASLSENGGSIAERASAKFSLLGVKDEENRIDYGFKVFSGFGDYRPPNIYCMDLNTEEVRRLDLDMRPKDTELLWKTLGLRSAGYTAPLFGYPEGIVFIAGPSVTPTSLQTTKSLPEVLGINMFAFDAATGRCIGSKNFPEYSNIRKWKEHDGELYTSVASQDGTGQVLKHNPSIFRWGFPFNFDVVGNLASGGAEIEVFEGRLFVNTWPGIEGNFDLGPENFEQILNIINGPASLYRSPVIPRGGLTRRHANDWSVVWSSVDYDPDFAISLHYGGGAMAVFDDYLYWGTTHVSGSAQVAHSIVYGGRTLPRQADYTSTQEYLAALARYTLGLQQDLLNPQRYISIWRGRNFNESTGEIDLLYGNTNLPKRISRSTFTRNGDPRGDFDLLRWALFIVNNLGQLGEIEDGEEVVLLSIPLLFGRSWDITTTFEDGGDWEIVPNVGGYVPLYGREGVTSVFVDADILGFGELFGEINYSGNYYTWSMDVLDGKLYFGTLDIGGTGIFSFLNPNFQDGADLYCFPDTNSPAELISNNAFGNRYAYGLRNIQADEERNVLYVGTANPSNLRHEDSLEKLANQPDNQDDNTLNDDATPDTGNGGWELLRVSIEQPAPPVEPPAVETGTATELADSVAAPDAWLLDPLDTESATIAFASVEDGASGLKMVAWPSFPGDYYTVYTASSAKGEWSPMQTYRGTGGTLSFEWDATGSDIRYVKIVESNEVPVASI